MKKFALYNLLLISGCIQASHAASNQEHIETITVEGRQINLIGEAISASEGTIGQQELKLRPLLRTGEILEAVPGMIVTQHSGTGKANQYFLRGFNLDHGTDFATFIDGMPINMRTHGHGQGYTDLNFLIPEAIDTITYQKGAYHSDTGDFGSAGSAKFSTATRFDQGLLQVEAGQDGYSRTVLLNSYKVNDGDLLLALERNQYDGPWKDINEDIRKNNGLIKFSKATDFGQFSVSLMAYENTWNSADQIPKRAVDQGLIGELGSIDSFAGGESSRYSANLNWKSDKWQASAYYIDYRLNLWSNFTYFQDDENRGDQFEQIDNRSIYGGQLLYAFSSELFDQPSNNRIGLDLRIDDIDEVGLHQTQRRSKTGVVRSDKVVEKSLGLFYENTVNWSSNLRTSLGSRFDYFDFDVTDKAGINTHGVNLSSNSGSDDDGLLSLKGNVIYTLSPEWEIYVSGGRGFHSNDARGATASVDPANGNSITKVDPLVKSLGYETGIRGFINDRLNTSLSVWTLDLDSELLFVGDAGNTEASRGSTRQGAELTLYYQFSDQWSLDIEYAYTDAAFTDSAPEGKHIPGTAKRVFQAGVNATLHNGWFGSLRVRHFGERPLIEDGSVKSDSSTMWNLRAGYRIQDWTFKTDILNLTNTNDHDIDYLYESRLPGEPSGASTNDIHYHVMEPRTVRVSVGYAF